ncbi:MAG: hypothetical protein JXJ22_06605 [Bacteroidales bacterium]|nr:hypothetical protein [Bacteroidales bacterium]
MKQIRWYLMVIFLVLSLSCYSQKSRYRREYNHIGLVEFGFVKERSLNLPGYIVSAEYFRRIQDNVAFMPLISYSGCRSESSGGVSSASIFTGSTIIYLGKDINRQLRINFGLGAVINKYYWQFKTGPEGTIRFLKDNKIYEINENSELKISDKPGIGYSLSFLLSYRFTPKTVFTLKPLIQNDTNGNALFAAQVGIGLAL